MTILIFLHYFTKLRKMKTAFFSLTKDENNLEGKILSKSAYTIIEPDKSAESRSQSHRFNNGFSKENNHLIRKT